MSSSLSEYTKIDVGWGFAPTPNWGSLQRSHSRFQGGRFAAGGEWRGGDWRTREGGGKEGGTGGMGKGGEKGEVGGIASWLLGDRRPCQQLTKYLSVAVTLPGRSKLSNWSQAPSQDFAKGQG